MELNNQYLLDHLRSIPDFPQKGINFRDVTTLFKDAKALEIMEEELYELYKDKGITKVVGLETRGYVMGAILARRLNAGFVMARILHQRVWDRQHRDTRGCHRRERRGAAARRPPRHGRHHQGGMEPREEVQPQEVLYELRGGDSR